MQVVMLVILVLSMLDILIGTFIPFPGKKKDGYEGYSSKFSSRCVKSHFKCG